MSSRTVVDHNDLYRLPWTLSDNAISWLEPTAQCNLVCDGCYRKNEANSHKPFAEVLAELDVFQSLRRSDCISIAGGDPLLYPQIIELVAEVKRRGLKPIINTNGKALTRELLRELARAGASGFTFHVDSGQRRGNEWDGKSELELCDLRLHYARMLAEEGNIACSFNSTVYAENIEHVPQLIDWAQQHIDIVQTMVFICFRHVIPTMPFDWYAGGRKVDWDEIWYHSDEQRKVTIGAQELVAKIRQTQPDFMPAAYLNGTHDPTAMKWLLTQRVGTKDRIYGYLGNRFSEFLSSWYHFRRGRYLSYVRPSETNRGKLAMMIGSLFDAEAKKAWCNWWGAVARNPLRLFRRAHIQSIMIIQPVDFMENGDQSMCDGCPDITVHDGKLVWSCRLEELKTYGRFLKTVPKEDAVAAEASTLPDEDDGRSIAAEG